LVGINNSIYSIAFRIKNITIQRKTMRSSMTDRWNFSSKSKCWNFLISIIVLKNSPYLLDSLYVLILDFLLLFICEM
jgi:hypothetical protein